MILFLNVLQDQSLLVRFPLGFLALIQVNLLDAPITQGGFPADHTFSDFDTEPSLQSGDSSLTWSFATCATISTCCIRYQMIASTGCFHAFLLHWIQPSQQLQATSD